MSAREVGLALGDPALQVDALLGLATKHLAAGEIEQSVASLEQAHQQATGAGLPRRSILAAARLASSLTALGEAHRSRPYIAEAMDAALELGFELGAAEARLGLGDVHYLTSELRDAQSDYEIALDGYRRLGNSAGMIEAHLSLGYALADLSEDVLATSHFERALELSRAEGDRRHEAIALRVLGNVYAKLSEGYRAIRYFEEARTLFEAAEDRASLVALNNGLGEVHAGLGDLGAALRYYGKAESLARSMGSRSAEGTALLEVANCHQRLGQVDVAARTYEAARVLFETIGDSAMAASALAGLGGLRASEGRFEAAVHDLNEALGLMQSAGKARQSSAILLTLSETYMTMGLIHGSRDAAQEALLLATEAVDLATEARALSILSRAARAQGALDEARQYAEQSLAVDESIRARVSGPQLRALFFEEVESRYSFYVDLLMEMEELRPDEAFDQLALEASERSRARVLLDSLRRASSGRRGVNEALLERERALLDGIRRQALLEDLGAKKTGGRDDAQLDDMLAELRRLQALVQSDPSSSGTPEASPSWDLDDVRWHLAGDKVLLVEYLLGPERSYLWTISKERFSARILPPREQIEEAAKNVYGLLTARQGDLGASARERRRDADREDARFYEAGAALARVLLGPIEDLDDFKRLIVVADGVLHYLPFSTLPHPRSLERGAAYQPLVVSHEIVRAPSLSALAAMRERSRERAKVGTGNRAGSRRRVAVLADPVFTLDDPRVRSAPSGEVSAPGGRALQLRAQGSGTTLETLPRLLASRAEASSIAKVAGSEVTVATGFSARRATAERMLDDGYGVVHFATHGVLNDQHPELSAVITSLLDERGQFQDGFLRAQDVFGMNVRAEVVVLSACETALGKMLRGEGITGLVRAFIHAGADTVVASKWKVDDVATQELMAEFYRQLLVEGADPAGALREAQLKLFRGKASRAPFFWGAFEVHGLS